MFKEISFTVYAVSDMPKARAFYEGVLGLTPSSEFDGSNNANWVEYNIGSTTLSVGCSPDWKPSVDGAVAALEAIDFDACIAKLKASGANFFMEPLGFPGCSMAVVTDPDKNRILIHRKK